MSSTNALFASPRTSSDPFKSILQTANQNIGENRMQSLLTSTGDPRARATSTIISKSSVPAAEMPKSTSHPKSFQSARERSERPVEGNGNGNSDNEHTSSGSSGMSPSWNRSPTHNNAVAVPNRSRNGSLKSGDLLSTVRPGSVEPEDVQLDVAYGYAIQRDDGSYTRLIRADDPRLGSVGNLNRPFREQQGREGLIVLPSPRQSSPGSRGGDDPIVPSDLLDRLPYTRQGRSRAGSRVDPNTVQRNIDTIVAQASVSPPGMANGRPLPPQRREKIYCDKWIHEGVCAFTQMGCKYRHEMPMDKATQMYLGLNHGVPNWYRRAYGMTPLSPQSPPAQLTSPVLASPPNNSGRLAGPWRRRIQAPPSMGNSSDPNQHHGQGSNGNSYGPIGQQPQHNQGAFNSDNRFSMLRGENGNLINGELKYEDDDDDEVLFKPFKPSKPR